DPPVAVPPARHLARRGARACRDVDHAFRAALDAEARRMRGARGTRCRQTPRRADADMPALGRILVAAPSRARPAGARAGDRRRPVLGAASAPRAAYRGRRAPRGSARARGLAPASGRAPPPRRGWHGLSTTRLTVSF